MPLCELCSERLPLHMLNFMPDPRAELLGDTGSKFICDPCERRALDQVYAAMARATLTPINEYPHLAEALHGEGGGRL